MKAEELRIGNLIMKDDEAFTVTGVTPRYVSYEHSGELTFNFRLEDVQPILITHEWLEKFGWVWNEECKSYEKYPNGDTRMNLSLEIGGSYTMFNYVLKAVIAERIYYVHQLQNLYFALTGKELQLTTDKQATDSTSNSENL